MARSSSIVEKSVFVEAEDFLQNRRIAITGAGRGLGRALAIAAADHGAETVLLGRDLRALELVAETIRARSGIEPQMVPCDLGKPENIASACKAVLDRKSKLDVLINNGAPWLEGRLDELSDTQIASTIAGAVSGTVLVTKGLLPGLYQSDCADIITVVSTSGIPGWDLDGGSVPFYAAKHGQAGFSDKLRHELKPRGIRVSAVFPPDFDDADPTGANWSRATNDDGARLSGREVVSTLLFILAAPRACTFPMVILDGMPRVTT